MLSISITKNGITSLVYKELSIKERNTNISREKQAQKGTISKNIQLAQKQAMFSFHILKREMYIKITLIYHFSFMRLVKI